MMGFGHEDSSQSAMQLNRLKVHHLCTLVTLTLRTQPWIIRAGPSGEGVILAVREELEREGFLCWEVDLGCPGVTLD